MRIDWRAVLGIVVSALFLWWAFGDEDLGEIGSRLASVDLVWLLTSGAIVTSGGVIGALRWQILLEPLGASFPLRWRWAALNIGFMVTNLFPVRLGEIARPYALSRMAGVGMPGVLGTVLLERVLDVVALLCLFVVVLLSPSFPAEATVAGQPIHYAATGAIVVAVVALAFVGALVTWPGGVLRLAVPLSRVVPDRLGARFVESLSSFMTGLESLRRPGAMVKALFWSCLLWLWWSAAFWASFRAFGVDLGPTAAVFTQCAVSIFIALPAGPGFVGAMEAGILVSLRDVFLLPTETALSVAVAYHLAGFVPVTLLGLYYAWALGLRLRSLESEVRTQ